MALDPKNLPQDADTLRRIVVDLAEQLDRSLAEQNKYQSLLRELLEAQRSRKSEQLSQEQLALFEAAWRTVIRKARTRKMMKMTSMAVRRAANNRNRGNRRSGADARRWRGI